MTFAIPQYYPRAWAADQELRELTAEEIRLAFPEGTDERPTRQTLNRALQYATNGVIYFLTHGVSEWGAEVQYATGGIVRFGDRFYRASAINANQAPDGGGPWEWMPWSKDALDALYLTMKHGDAHFLSIADADQRFYSREQMNALFMTQADMALVYVTRAALAAEYITREQAESIFLTQALADARYALYDETITVDFLAQILEDYLPIAEAIKQFLTRQSGDAVFLLAEQAKATFLTQQDAPLLFEAKEDAAISRFNLTKTYSFGVLVFDSDTNAMYRSLADNNLGNPLSDAAHWESWTVPTSSNRR